jgi:hypothetical protein
VSEIFEYRRYLRYSTAYARLAVSGMDAVFDNFMDGTAVSPAVQAIQMQMLANYWERI